MKSNELHLINTRRLDIERDFRAWELHHSFMNKTIFLAERHFSLLLKRCDILQEFAEFTDCSLILVDDSVFSIEGQNLFFVREYFQRKYREYILSQTSNTRLHVPPKNEHVKTIFDPENFNMPLVSSINLSSSRNSLASDCCTLNRNSAVDIIQRNCLFVILRGLCNANYLKSLWPSFTDDIKTPPAACMLRKRKQYSGPFFDDVWNAAFDVTIVDAQNILKASTFLKVFTDTQDNILCGVIEYIVGPLKNLVCFTQDDSNIFLLNLTSVQDIVEFFY